MGFQMISGESVVKEGSANYQKGWEAVNGKLVLTTHRLFFESNKLNVQRGGIGIDLREMSSVVAAWTKFLGFIPMVPNSLAVRASDGTTHSFVVFGRADWIRAIDQQRQVRAGR